MRTRQGVRDLNGPKLDGRGVNGHRAVTCPHFVDPSHPTTRTTRGGNDVYVCNGCGEVRYTEAERRYRDGASHAG